MKTLATLFGILWRGTLLLPLMVMVYFLILAFLIGLPLFLLVVVWFVSPWAWAGLAVWLISVYVFRSPLRAYFAHRSKDGYL
jgi:hypothetical protein